MTGTPRVRSATIPPTAYPLPSRRRRPSGENGAVAVLVLMLTPMLLALGGLVLDGGRAISARQQAANLAEQAARAGADTLDVSALRADGTNTLDQAAATAAACRYVTLTEPTWHCTATVTFTSGVSGSGRAGEQLGVTVTGRTRTVLLGLVGINTIRVGGQASARAATGITNEIRP